MDEAFEEGFNDSCTIDIVLEQANSVAFELFPNDELKRDKAIDSYLKGIIKALED